MKKILFLLILIIILLLITHLSLKYLLLKNLNNLLNQNPNHSFDYTKSSLTYTKKLLPSLELTNATWRTEHSTFRSDYLIFSPDNFNLANKAFNILTKEQTSLKTPTITLYIDNLSTKIKNNKLTEINVNNINIHNNNNLDKVSIQNVNVTANQNGFNLVFKDIVHESFRVLGGVKEIALRSDEKNIEDILLILKNCQLTDNLKLEVQRLAVYTPLVDLNSKGSLWVSPSDNWKMNLQISQVRKKLLSRVFTNLLSPEENVLANLDNKQVDVETINNTISVKLADREILQLPFNINTFFYCKA